MYLCIFCVESPQEKRGRIHLVGEEVIESKSVIRFDIAARNVENKCSYLESFIWNVHSADLMYYG